MRFLTFILLFFIFLGCNHKTVNTNSPLIKHNSLQVKRVIPKNYPMVIEPDCDSLFINYFFNNESYNIKSWLMLKESKTTWVQFEAIEELSACFYDDPYHNIFITIDVSSSKVLSMKHIPTVDNKDLTFKKSFNENTILAFEYYSSPVGYVELIIFDAVNNQWYKTERMDEPGEIILNSIDIASKEIKFNTKEGKQKRDIHFF